MPMTQAKLKAELIALPDAETEEEAIDAIAQALANYAADAIAGTVPIEQAGIDLGVTLITQGDLEADPPIPPTLAGLKEPGAGSAVFSAAVVAFWGAIALGLTVSFPGAAAIVPPPGLSQLKDTLDVVFAANIASKADRDTACDNIATAIHSLTVPGGTVTIPPTPTPFPIT